MGDDYTIVGNNNYVFVKGAEVITIEGKTRILVKDQAFLEVEGGLSITSNKNIGIQTAGIMGLICDKFEVSATNGMDFASSGPINIQGTSVNLSASDGSIVEAASRGIFHTAGEDVNVSAGKATRLEAGSEFTTKSGTATRLQSGNALDIKSAQNINIDAGQQVNIRMGLSQNAPAATKQNRTNLSRRQAPEEKTPESQEPDPIDRNASGQDRYLGDDDPDSTDEWNKREEDAGRTISTAEIPPATETTTYGRATAAPRFVGDCREFENLPKGAKELNAMPLSTNFKLGDLIRGGWSLQSQSGLPPYKIVCNLRNLCRNVLDPIKAKYPDLKINSGLRNITDKFPNEKSDHLRGCAVDISFSSTNRNLSELRDRAAWIQANIPYKQLLLEYTKDSKGKINSGWIHISHEISETSGSLIPTGGTPVATLVNHRFEYPKKLVNLA
jgi:hypothetical protein